MDNYFQVGIPSNFSNIFFMYKDGRYQHNFLTRGWYDSEHPLKW